jgi:Mrp family chromosome partitioning ATPase
MNKSVHPLVQEAQVQRTIVSGDQAQPDLVREAWDRLRPISLNPSTLKRNRVITADRRDPAFGAFDVLRTKLVQVLPERGWRRVGVSSPTKGCGKSFVSLNLAITLSRYGSFRTILLDFDMRLPSLAHKLGAREAGAIGDFLRGLVPLETALRRVGPNPLRIGSSVALGLNGRPEPFASELLHDPKAYDALRNMEAALDPNIVLFDLPPILAQDDVLALKPHLDCILMVAGGGITTPRDLREASKRLGEDLPILGVVLNRAEGEEILDYRY